MLEINRSLVMLKPKQPFLDWARSLDDEDEDLTLDQLAEDSTAYLIQELWEDSDQLTSRSALLKREKTLHEPQTHSLRNLTAGPFFSTGTERR
jgi:hypothetical protein